MTPIKKALKYSLYALAALAVMSLLKLGNTLVENVLFQFFSAGMGIFIILFPILFIVFYVKNKLNEAPSVEQMKESVSKTYSSYSKSSSCKCPKCLKSNNCNDTFCSSCGAVMSEPTSQKTAKVRCERCNGENDTDTKFCIHCGNTLSDTSKSNSNQQSSPKKSCKNCGYENETDTKFCIKCGSNTFASSEKSSSSAPTHEDYQIIGCSYTDSDDTIKQSYREMAKKYHPDTVQGKGLADGFLEFANEKLKEINSAYERIKTQRGMR